MDPIAVINYTDAQGYENIHPCYDMATLEIVTARFKQRNYMFFVCMTSVNYPIPFNSPRHRVNPVHFVNSHSLYSEPLKTGTTP